MDKETKDIAPTPPPVPVAEARADAQPAPEVKVEKSTPELPENAPDVDRIAELEARLEAAVAAAEAKTGALEAKIKAREDQDRLAMLRRMGADPALIPDADLLALAPKVNPDTGADELLRWKESRPQFFKREPSRAVSIEQYRQKAKADGVKESTIARRAAILERLLNRGR